MLRTPQVSRIIQDAVSIICSADCPPILSISGLPGSGLSTAMDEIFKALKLKGFLHVYKIGQTVADIDVTPTEKLLRHFGFSWNHDAIRSSAARPLSEPIKELARMLGPSILLVEDYLNDAASSDARAEYFKIWERLTTSPLDLRVALIGPNQSGNRVSKTRKPLRVDLWIEAWRHDQSLKDYLDELSVAIYRRFDLSTQLSRHAASIYNLSSGNTARMIEFIRQVAIHSVLTRSTEIPSHLFNLSLRELVYSNAHLHSSLAHLG